MKQTFRIGSRTLTKYATAHSRELHQ